MTPGIVEAGTDEAGRGCLAGPVFAAAVILPPNFEAPLLNDSKKLTGKRREALRTVIEENAVCWGVAMVHPVEIDEINILNASILAMHNALEKLETLPEHILVDGNRFKPYEEIPFTTVIKGDATFLSIAAASVLAKTHRDAYMKELHRDYPGYGWNTNKGYPTRGHRRAIEAHGVTEHHRMSFRLLPEQLKLDL
jgi:ribonuclease HII